MNTNQQKDIPMKKMKRNTNTGNEKKTTRKFPSELQFNTAAYVFKEALKVHHLERSPELVRNFEWARLICDIRQVKFREILNYDLEKILRAKATENANVEIPDYKKIRTATCIFRCIMKTPESKRDENQKNKLKWCQDVLNMNDDQLYYIYKTSTYVKKKSKAPPAQTSNAIPKANTTNTTKPANKSNVTAVNKRHIPVIISNPNDNPARSAAKANGLTLPNAAAMTFPKNTSSYTCSGPPQPTPLQGMTSMSSFQNSFSYNSHQANMMYPSGQKAMQQMTPMNNFQAPFIYNQRAENTPYPVYPSIQGASASANTFQSSSGYNPLDVNAPNSASFTAGFQSHANNGNYLNPSSTMMYPNNSTTCASSQPTKMVIEPNYVGAVSPKEELVVGLVDRNHVYGDISPANMELVNNRLIPLFLEVLKQRPEFVDHKLNADLYQGRIMLFTFENQRAVELFKKTVYNLGGLWPSADITAIPKSCIPHRPRYRAFIPAEPSDPETVLKVIKVGNPNLPTYNWEVIKVDPVHKNKRCICIVMNKESFEPLFAQDMTINYGFGCIRLKIFKRDKLPSEKAAFEAKYSHKPDPVASQSVASSLKKSAGRHEIPSRSAVDESRKKEDTVTLLAEAILKQLNEMERADSKKVSNSSAFSNWF